MWQILTHFLSKFRLFQSYVVSTGIKKYLNDFKCGSCRILVLSETCSLAFLIAHSVPVVGTPDDLRILQSGCFRRLRTGQEPNDSGLVTTTPYSSTAPTSGGHSLVSCYLYAFDQFSILSGSGKYEVRLIKFEQCRTLNFFFLFKVEDLRVHSTSIWKCFYATVAHMKVWLTCTVAFHVKR